MADHLIYDDTRIYLEYKGISKIPNLYYGERYVIKFVVHNKTSYEMKVSATELKVNGFRVNDDIYTTSEVPPNRKIFDSIDIYSNKLNVYRIYSIDDIYKIEFRVRYEIEDMDCKHISEIISIDGFKDS